MSILRRKMFFAGDEAKKDFKQDRNEAIKIIQEERKKRGLPSGRGALFSQRDFMDQVRRYMQGESLLSIFPDDRFVGSGNISLPRFDSIQDPTARSDIKPPVPQTFAEPQINRNALIRYYFNQGFNTADISNLESITAGRSLKECTATSIFSSINCCSIAETKTPLPPISCMLLFSKISPSVLIVIRLDSKLLKHCASTCLAYSIASLLPLTPMFILALHKKATFLLLGKLPTPSD